jgi:hypothetical protein
MRFPDATAQRPAMYKLSMVVNRTASGHRLLIRA